MGHLMQVAGRAIRWAQGKKTAHVVQVRASKLDYHFDQRSLNQDISDALRPTLHDIPVSTLTELVDQVERIMAEQGCRTQLLNGFALHLAPSTLSARV
ncbi:hypothetical protein GCM10009841_15340 [Microlunatus panaciterrae]